MTDLAPVLQGFFTDRLARQKKASPNTVAAYRDTCRLLLAFAQDKIGKPPSQLSLADLDATLVGAFLQHLEDDRGNGSATRNARLAAIHSLFKYEPPGHPSTPPSSSQVLAIPPRRRERAIVSSLTPEETDADRRPRPEDVARPPRPCPAPARRPDRAAGLRTHRPAPRQDVHLGRRPLCPLPRQGPQDRATPLTPQIGRVLRTWLAELSPNPGGPLFPASGGRGSRDAVERLVAKHAATAASSCPSIKEKNVTPHTLRHTAAMSLLKAGVDTSVIALWLGHEGPKPRKSTFMPT